MNPTYTEFRFPQIKAHPWSKARSAPFPPTKPPHSQETHLPLVQIRHSSSSRADAPGRRLSPLCSSAQVFHKQMPQDAVNLVSHLLQYSPSARYNALQAREPAAASLSPYPAPAPEAAPAARHSRRLLLTAASPSRPLAGVRAPVLRRAAQPRDAPPQRAALPAALQLPSRGAQGERDRERGAGVGRGTRCDAPRVRLRACRWRAVAGL